jgi:beta-hydroxyacyl-ACP dehydratase FabZ
MKKIQEIMQILPHRYPFLLVDRILEIKKGKRVIGIKNVTVNEQFFMGHFPEMPVMPGVLIIEAMAQTGAIIALYEEEFVEGKLLLFTGIDRCKFKKPVVPGDQLHMELDVIGRRGPLWKMNGTALVDGTVVAKSILSAIVVDRDNSG